MTAQGKIRAAERADLLGTVLAAGGHNYPSEFVEAYKSQEYPRQQPVLWRVLNYLHPSLPDKVIYLMGSLMIMAAAVVRGNNVSGAVRHLFRGAPAIHHYGCRRSCDGRLLEPHVYAPVGDGFGRGLSPGRP